MSKKTEDIVQLFDSYGTEFYDQQIKKIHVSSEKVEPVFQSIISVAEMDYLFLFPTMYNHIRYDRMRAKFHSSIQLYSQTRSIFRKFCKIVSYLYCTKKNGIQQFSESYRVIKFQ